MRQLFLIIFLTLAAAGVNADVFSLRPRGGSGTVGGVGNAAPGSLPTLLGNKQIMEEPVVVNGMQMTLKIFLVNDSLASCFTLLRRDYGDARFQTNSDSLLVNVKSGAGSVRLLLVKLGAGYPAVQFSIEVPDAIPTIFDWPKDLPLISDAVPMQYMSFTARGVMYGIFSTRMRPEAALQEFVADVQSSGWVSLSTAGIASNGSGHVFVRKSPPGLLAVNFTSGKGIVFLRPLK